MLLFGHLGITAGVFTAPALWAKNRGISLDPETKPGLIGRIRNICFHLLNTINGEHRTIDCRLVFIGSMLPDIIDKPTWMFAFGDIFSTGRGYAHSFMFNIVLLLIALVLLRYRKSWLLVISLSSFIHLVLDQIWNQPLTLWWPLGGPLPKVETTGWYSYLVEGLISSPSVYIPEIIGLMVLVLMGAKLVMKRRITHFFRTGLIE